MKIKLTDQLHISAFGADTKPAGEVLDVTDALGADLVTRGLATKVSAAKAAPAPANKAARAPRNKGAGKPAGK